MSELKVDTIAGSGGTTVTIKTGHTLTLVEDMDAGSNKITNVTDPTSAQDVATKAYVDTQLLTLDTLGELTNVTITSVADNEVLAYDSSTSEWINQTASEAGLATSGDFTTHTSNTSNPHSVTVDQVFTTVPTGDLDINSNKLINVTDPSSAQDAATKNYVDTQVESKDQLSELSGTSDDIAEGTTNLYLTNERIDDRFNNLFQDGTALTGTYDDASNTYTLNLDALTLSEFDATVVVTEGEGLNSSDSDASFPTTAAVKDYVDTEVTNAVTGGSTLSSATLNKDDNTIITEYQVTVADDGSGSQNVFFYDGEKEGRLNLQAGETVRFILSDSSVASHPFALSVTKDGSHDSGSEYTTGKTSNGTQGTAGAYIDYVIDAGSEDTLYPYCTSHSGMGGASVFVTGKYINEDSTSTLTNKSIDSDNNTITNIVDADIKASAGIDATKIADGSVTDAEFQYVGGLTSDAQTQIDSKLAHTGGEIKDYKETVATTASAGTSFTSNTLTLDVEDGNVFDITLDDNITTWTINNMDAGTTVTCILRQDATGSRTAPTAINSTTIKTVGAGGLTLTTDASAIDIVTVFYDGTDYLVFAQLALG